MRSWSYCRHDEVGMSMNRKFGSTSPDGEIQAKIEHYVDDTCSRAIVTATYRGKSGQVVFTATETGVDVSFSGDEISMSAKNTTITSGENTNISGNNIAVQASDKTLISSGSELILQVLSGIIELSSAKQMKLGSREKISIKTLANILLQATKRIEIITRELTVTSNNIRLGTGTRKVALVGDAVAVSGSSGTITGPGSTILLVD